MLRTLYPCFLCLAVLPTTLFIQTVSRFEQSDSRIVYTGTWYPNSNTLESGGSALLANLNGSQAMVVFNGTGLSWIGTSDYYSGICYVTLDGVPNVVDTSNPTGSTLYQQRLFTASNLAPGIHRMTIEAIHSHDASTNQSWIWVDALDITSGSLVDVSTTTATAGSFEQGSVAANYSGHWFQNVGGLYSGGSVNQAVDVNARVDFTFNGTSITWIGYRDEYSGIAQVLVDGALQATVDTYLAPSKAQTPTYTLSGLSPGTHVFSIIVTGTHNATSGGSSVWVDGFQVGGGVTVARPAIGAGGVVNAASFLAAPNNQLAPGQIVSVFGANFLASGRADASALPLPTQLGSGNTTVTACGRPVPLFSVFPGQINAQLPFECASGTSAVTVTVGGQTSTAQNITSQAGSPGIFTVGSTGTGDGVILHADNSLVSASNPAHAGEQLVIYATGLGPVSPPVVTGSAAAQTNATLMPVTVMIGGLPATVKYSGLSVGLVGLHQVNAIVPAGITGSQPVVMTVGGSYTSRAGVTMSVQ